MESSLRSKGEDKLAFGTWRIVEPPRLIKPVKVGFGLSSREQRLDAAHEQLPWHDIWVADHSDGHGDVRAEGVL